MLRSAFSKLLLVLALLFTQQVVLMHTIEHSLLEQKASPAAPQHQHCDLCAIDAQMGSAVGSHIHFDFSSTFEETHPVHITSYSHFAFAAFAARAPPYAA